MRAARWRDVLGRVESGQKIFVALQDAALVGFAGVGPARDEAGDRGELYMINVLPSAWGTGAATALLDHSLQALAKLGHREAILWVLRQNARARRFYRREGFAEEGDRHDTIEENGFSFEVDEIRCVRAL